MNCPQSKEKRSDSKLGSKAIKKKTELMNYYKSEFYDKEQDYFSEVFTKIHLTFSICFLIKMILVILSDYELLSLLYYIIVSLSSFLFQLISRRKKKFIQPLAILAPVYFVIIKLEIDIDLQAINSYHDYISIITVIIYLVLHFSIIKNQYCKYIVIFGCYGYFLLRLFLSNSF